MAARLTAKTSGRVTPAFGLLALCLLWMLGSLRSDLLPHQFPASSDQPSLARAALQYAVLALGAALFTRARSCPWPDARFARNSAIVGIGLLAVPTLMIHFASPWVSDLTRVALFSLAPLFAVVFEPHIGRQNQPQVRGSLMASLIAVAGTLCLIPIDEPHSFASICGLCIVISATICAAAANCLAVRVACEFPATSIAPMIAIESASIAFCFAATSALTERQIMSWHTLTQAPVLVWIVAADIPALLLLFWLMRRLSAVRMTTRFLIAPLMTSLVGLFLFQPSVTLRAGLGLLLIAFGAAWLLLAPKDSEQSSASLLNLSRD